MKTIALLVFMLIAASLQTPGKLAALPADERRPKITVEEALDIAKTHFEKQQIDVSESYISSVQFDWNPRGKKGEYWKITRQAAGAKGGQTFLFVYADKSVEIGYGE